MVVSATQSATSTGLSKQLLQHVVLDSLHERKVGQGGDELPDAGRCLILTAVFRLSNRFHDLALCEFGLLHVRGYKLAVLPTYNLFDVWRY
ncbi:MAG: hypothetical protein RL160_1811 [Bacteroidota bacterium]|jgi:hypothetical protein